MFTPRFRWLLRRRNILVAAEVEVVREQVAGVEELELDLPEAELVGAVEELAQVPAAGVEAQLLALEAAGEQLREGAGGVVEVSPAIGGIPPS